MSVHAERVLRVSFLLILLLFAVALGFWLYRTFSNESEYGCLDSRFSGTNLQKDECNQSELLASSKKDDDCSRNPCSKGESLTTSLPDKHFQGAFRLLQDHLNAVASRVTFAEDELLSQLSLTNECEKALRQVESGGIMGSSDGQDWWYYNNFLRNTPRALKGNPEFAIGGFYVEVGANRPYKLSNTAFLDECLGWKGICIEADPKNTAKFQGTRRTCKVINKIIVAEKGAGVKEEAHKEGADWGNNWEKVPMSTLAEIFADEGVTHVDFLTVDVEGFEGEILKGINLTDWNVDVVSLEANRSPFSVDMMMYRMGYWKMESLGRDDHYIKMIPSLLPRSGVHRNEVHYQWRRCEGTERFLLENLNEIPEWKRNEWKKKAQEKGV